MTIPQEFTMDTRRCHLRIVSVADFPHIISATRFPEFNDGMPWEPPGSAQELLVPYERNIAAWMDGLAYTFTIELKPSAQFVGRIAIRRQQPDEDWNIGFWTHPDSQGKGYMSESAAEVVRFGFATLGAMRIEARHADWNRASAAVLNNIGMRPTGHVDQGFMKRGNWVPETILAITRTEWEALRVSGGIA
jgi:[ribosomal protein S5]-alanine N-acetyltransferase